MIKREIEICGKLIPFGASATTPRLYRAKFKREIFVDFQKLQKAYSGKIEDDQEFLLEDLEIFENVAYIMAFQADHTIPADINDWLDQFEMFSIYQIMPELMALWGDNMATEIESKKALAEVTGR